MKKLICPDCGREFEFPEHSTSTQTGLDALPVTLKIVCNQCGYTLEVKYEIKRRTKIMLRRLANQQRRQNAATQNTEKRF